ncbi:MAG: hypothetical protein IT581_21195 [Verrucomicrobiales bacterium]|nr:hypothetical protein [Verrucomicrobiales bacterium]
MDNFAPLDFQPGSSRADRRKKISRVVVGSVTVRIYHGINQVAGRDYPQHTVIYHETDGGGLSVANTPSGVVFGVR